MEARARVLDASAVLAVLLGESGEETIRRISVGAAMSTINLAEVLQSLSSEIEMSEHLDDVAALGIELVPLSAEQAATAAEIRDATQPHGLSLADRACLALALERNAIAVTGDKAWDEVDVGVEVMQFR